MTVVATVWGPEPGSMGDLAGQGIAVHSALGDQGPYSRGEPFGAFIVARDDLSLTSVTGATVWAWRVDEQIAKAAPATCDVAMVSLMRRRAGTTPAEFRSHWLDRHAPLARRHHVGLADYHQFVVVECLTPSAPEIDGIAQLGFVTREDFEHRFFDSDAGRAEIMADVARFMDRPGPETTLVGPAGPAGRSG